MKKMTCHFVLILFALITLISCDNKDPEDLFPSELVQGAYVINYGNYGNGGASISKYDYYTGTLTNFYNEAQNSNREFLSNIQFAYPYRDSIFLIGNSPDQVITLNPLIVQSKNGLTDKIANPRYCIANGDYLYISCLGVNPDWIKMPGSYIAKYKIGSNKVENTFDLPGGPEGMQIANGKIYIALNYKDSIAVFDLKTEQFSYLETPAVSSYFLEDNNGNLYVTFVSTYNNPSSETGLGFINTYTNKLDTIYKIDNISSNYGSVISSNSSFSKIYVVTSAYDVNWNLTGAVAEFNVSTKTFSTKNFVDNISGISGVSVNQTGDDVYVFSAPSATGAGTMQIFSPAGNLTSTHAVGAFPIGAFFLK